LVPEGPEVGVRLKGTKKGRRGGLPSQRVGAHFFFVRAGGKKKTIKEENLGIRV